MRHRPVWLDEHTIDVDGVHFYVTIDVAERYGVDSHADRFVLSKSRALIDTLLDVAPKRVDHIVDLGIFKGGSVAFNAQTFRPTKLLAIEADTDRVPALDEYIRLHGLGDRVRCRYGLDQADQATLRAELTTMFESRSLDLVIDDCSHLYHQTKASLNVLLPELRDGGVFVIEDWGWAHWEGDFWQQNRGPYPDQPAMSNLIFELVMLSASRPDVVTKVQVEHSMVVVWRGPADLGPEFDLSTAYLSRGAVFSPIL